MTLNKHQRNHIEAMGLVRWIRRDVPSEPVATQVTAEEQEAVPVDRQRDAARSSDPAGMDWEMLTRTIQSCSACDLHHQRHHAVVGAGNREADWMIIGEAPGEQEDLQGEPFVGRAGVLLNNILTAVGLSRETVYIANVIKCRPPGNRDPHTEEISSCLPYLKRQIELIQPKIILVVGRIAAQTLLNTDSPVGKMRGTIHAYGARQIPLVVTYHPAYLLRRPGEKIKTWHDLKLALSVMRVPGDVMKDHSD